MSFDFAIAGRACLAEWTEPMAVSDIFTLLIALHRSESAPSDYPLLIVRIGATVPPVAPNVLSAIAAALPALLDCCDELLIAVEGDSPDRAELRSTFESSRRSAAHAPTRFFDSLSEALTHGQRRAPHDVLELQRLVLRRSVPPSAIGRDSPTSQVWRCADGERSVEQPAGTIRRNR